MFLLRPNALTLNSVLECCQAELLDLMQLIKALIAAPVTLIVSFKQAHHVLVGESFAPPEVVVSELSKVSLDPDGWYEMPAAASVFANQLDADTLKLFLAHKKNCLSGFDFLLFSQIGAQNIAAGKRQALAICLRQLKAITKLAISKCEFKQSILDIRTALTSASVGAWGLDVALGQFFCDQALAHMLGLNSEANSHDFDMVLDRIEPETRAKFLYTIGRANNVSGQHRQTFRLQAGKWLAASFVRDQTSVQPVYIGLMRDNDQQAELELENQQHQAQLESLVRELRRSSRVDALTGLMNRAGFNEQFQVIASNQRKQNEWLSILIIDVDHFKTFNDTFGHAEGDIALKQVANEIAASVRGSDIAVRFGGEEFCVLSQSDPELASKIGERIRSAVQASSWARRAVTVSIGIDSERGGAIDQSVMFKRADQALYQAKALGRNRVVRADRIDLNTTPND